MIWIIFGLFIYTLIVLRSMWVINHVRNNHFDKITKFLLPLSPKLTDKELKNQELQRQMIAFEISTILLFLIFIISTWIIPNYTWLVLAAIFILLMTRILSIQRLARKLQQNSH